MSISVDDQLIARNPATGEPLARLPITPVEDVAGIVERARAAQAEWGRTSWPHRRALLRRWWKILARDADDWAVALRDEIGKPAVEAMAAEVLPTLDALRWTLRNGGRALGDERIAPGWQRWLLLPPARLEWRPVGVVAIVATWNYPLFLTVPAIAHALAAGNAVVWKPSELASAVGRKIQASLAAVGVPKGLVEAVYGGAEVGRALVDAPVDKGHFTGGVENGRHVLTALASRGIPAVAELSGFDPAVVLPDAPFDSTIRALTWSAFTNAGQTCVAVKRAIVVGGADEARRWADALAEQARSLRVGDPARDEVEVGPLICEAARERFAGYLRAAVAAGARVLAGGEALPGPGAFFAPTVLLADPDNNAPETVLTGCFGPVVIVRAVPDVEAAVAAANAGPFGLAASVWGRDLRAARALAARIEAGTVTINDAIAPTAHAGAPFGGVKASGYGRVHGELGLREFAQPRVVFERSAGGLRPQLFPYSGKLLTRSLRFYRRMFHG